MKVANYSQQILVILIFISRFKVAATSIQEYKIIQNVLSETLRKPHL